MVLQTKMTKKGWAHMENTFQNDLPFGLHPYFWFYTAVSIFSHKHLMLGIPLIITNSLNLILEPMDCSECEKAAIFTRSTWGGGQATNL